MFLPCGGLQSRQGGRVHRGLLCTQKPSVPLRDEVRSLRQTGGKQPLSLRMRDVGQARTRQDVARMLGGHRNSIGCWLTRYEMGGLRALLARYLPAGKPLSLSPPSWLPLCKRYSNPPALPLTKPCVSGASRPLTERSTIAPSTPSSTPSSKPRSRSHGPVTPKNPEAMAAFQATSRARFQRVLLPDDTRPIRVFS